MIEFCNYLDIPDEKKNAVLEQLLQIGFCPAYGKLKTIKKEIMYNNLRKLETA